MAARGHKLRRSPTGWAEFWCEAGLDQEGFRKVHISNDIGYGVVATKVFARGDFLLEYCGDRINGLQAERRVSKGNCFLFGFRFNEQSQWIDASKTTSERFAGLVNDAENGTKECNSKMKLQMVKNYPRLCLFATRDIDAGEEIRYDLILLEELAMDFSW